jgi:antitoxin (DNA-binding transcriptional repressor) of toxin-antitoxin stability system
MCYIVRMTKTVTLRDANQQFARCICEVEAGEEFVITATANRWHA